MDIIFAREFGKIAPYLRKKGCQPCKWLVTLTREHRLFNKNACQRKPETVSMLAEACPVTVSENRVQPDEGPLNGGGNYDPLKVTIVALSKADHMLEQLRIPHYRATTFTVPSCKGGYGRGWSIVW